MNNIDDEMQKKLIEYLNKAEPSEKKDLRGLIEEFKTNDNICEVLLGVLLKMNNKLKYTIEELETIEDKINGMYPQGHKPMSTATLVPFGMYLGNMLIKKIPGAKWVVSDEANKNNDIMEVGIRIPSSEKGEMELKPFLRVHKYWKNREDKLSTMVRFAEFNYEISLNPKYWSKRADKDGWITLAWGDMFRVFHAKKGSEGFDDMKGLFHEGKYDKGK